MEITFVNVGYGDAILLRNNGHAALIDGGSSLEEEYTTGPNRIRLFDYLKKNNIGKLDFVILTHIHEDHVCGVADILRAIEVGMVYVPYLPSITGKEAISLVSEKMRNIVLYTRALNDFKEILASSVEKRMIASGDCIEFQGAVLRVLEPSRASLAAYSAKVEQVFCENSDAVLDKLIELDELSNTYSLVIGIEYNGKGVLLAADNCPLNWRKETLLFAKNGNVLKLPHHGQADSIDETLIEYLAGGLIVTCSSSDKRNNSANRSVYDRLSDSGKEFRFLFTDEVSYTPYFAVDAGFQAILLGLDDREISVRFDWSKTEQGDDV
jgi:competence protein ComEC